MSSSGEVRDVICTACPRGCPLQVRVLREVVQVDGASCRRGVAFGEAEALDPKRVLTTTVRVDGGSAPVVPVRTREPISRTLLDTALEQLHRTKLVAPVAFRQVVLLSVAGSGVDVVACASVEPAPGGRMGAPQAAQGS